MIYNNSNFIETYNNANGRGAQNLALNEFTQILGTNPDVIKGALLEAGVRLPRNVSNEGIVKAIQRNSSNPKLKKYLGAVVVASAEVDSYDHFLGKKKDGTPRAGTKFFSNIFKKKDKDPNKTKGKGIFGGFFKKDEETGKSKFGSWFSKNKDNINDVGGSLLSGLTKPKNSQDVVEGADYYGNKGTNNQDGGGKKPMSMLVKVGIGVAVIGVLAFIVYKMRGKKGRK
jgi:hypothetical protein